MRLLAKKHSFFTPVTSFLTQILPATLCFQCPRSIYWFKLIKLSFRCTVTLSKSCFPRAFMADTKHKGNKKCYWNSRTADHVTDQGRVKVSSAKSRLKKKQESRRAFRGEGRGPLGFSKVLEMRHVFTIHSTALVPIAFNRLPFSDNLSPPTLFTVNNTEVVDLTACAARFNVTLLEISPELRLSWFISILRIKKSQCDHSL
jgi:hypothetical protein